jgi:hypothetical protein
MPFNRFILPVLPAFVVLFVWGLSDLVHVARPFGRLALLLVLPVVALATVGVARLMDSHSIETPAEEFKVQTAEGITRHTRGLLRARALYQYMLREPGETLATDYGGVFAMFTDARVIEMWGLCNEDIALRGTTEGVNPIYGKACIECVAEMKPVYFHVNVPLVRPLDAIGSSGQLIADVFLGKELDQSLDFRRNYVVGRVVNVKTRSAFYFFERRRPDVRFRTRRPQRNIVVEYPFLGAPG